MLLPQQLQRHPWAPPFAVKGRPIRLRPAVFGRERRRREESALQGVVGQFVGNGQVSPTRRARRMDSPAAVALTPRLAAIWRLDIPAADSLSTSRILRMGNLGPGIGSVPCMEKNQAMLDSRSGSVQYPAALSTAIHKVVAIARNCWSRSTGFGGRAHPERAVAITRTRWSRSIGGRDRPVRAPWATDRW